MYTCCGCGKIFSIPAKVEDIELFWGRPVPRMFNVSPCCHDDYTIYDDDDEEDVIDDGDSYDDFRFEEARDMRCVYGI